MYYVVSTFLPTPLEYNLLVSAYQNYFSALKTDKVWMSYLMPNYFNNYFIISVE